MEGKLRRAWFTCRVMWTAQNPPGGTWEGSSMGQVINLQSSGTCHWSQPAWLLLGRDKANKISHGQKDNKQWFPIWAQIEYLRAGSLNFRCWFVIDTDFPWSCFFHGQFDGAFSGVIYTMLVNDCLEQYQRDQPEQKKLPTAWIDIDSLLRCSFPQTPVMLCTLCRPPYSSHLGLYSPSSWTGAQVSSSGEVLTHHLWWWEGLPSVSTLLKATPSVRLQASPRTIHFPPDHFSLHVIYFQI